MDQHRQTVKAVVDASFILSTVFDESTSKDSRDAFEAIRLSEIYVPSQFNQEVSQAIYIGLQNDRISKIEANLFLKYLSELEFTVASSPNLLRLNQFCNKNQISSYDASYLLLAQDLGATLFTQDQQMKAIAKRLTIGLW